MNKQLKIGWAEVSITPDDRPVSLAGQFFERISEYVESPITATAMAIENGDQKAVICSVDIVAIGENLMEMVRENVAKETDLDPMNVIIAATHSHTSHVYDRQGKPNAYNAKTVPILKRFLPEEAMYKPHASSNEAMTPTEALCFLVERISKAVIDAWNNRKAASYACSFGRAAVGMCRRVTYNDGSAKMWGDANSATFVAMEGGNDSGIEILYTFDENENITGVVANICCPSQVVEHRSFVSADYWGKVKEYLREHFGDKLYLLALGGPGGDQCPRDLVRWVQPETPIDDPNIERPYPLDRRADGSMFDIQGIKRIGRRVAHEIIMAYEDREVPENADMFKHECVMVDLPIRRVTPAEYEASVEAIRAFAKENGAKPISYVEKARLYIYAGNIARYEYQHNHDMETIETHHIRLGDIAFTTNPFELFLDYGNQIRARSYAKQTFIIQLCCGAYGYLPTEKAEKAGHYSAYISSGAVGHEGGDLLVRKALETINGFFK